MKAAPLSAAQAKTRNGKMHLAPVWLELECSKAKNWDQYVFGADEQDQDNWKSRANRAVNNNNKILTCFTSLGRCNSYLISFQ